MPGKGEKAERTMKAAERAEVCGCCIPLARLEHPAECCGLAPRCLVMPEKLSPAWTRSLVLSKSILTQGREVGEQNNFLRAESPPMNIIQDSHNTFKMSRMAVASVISGF